MDLSFDDWIHGVMEVHRLDYKKHLSLIDMLEYQGLGYVNWFQLYKEEINPYDAIDCLYYNMRTITGIDYLSQLNIL